MKKLLLFCFLLTLESLNYSSPRCLDHETSKFKSPSRKSPLLLTGECNCPCEKYPRSHHADGYKCLICDHRMLPSPIETSSEQTPDNLTSTGDAFIASALVTSAKKLYDESKQPKPIVVKPQPKTEESWMNF